MNKSPPKVLIMGDDTRSFLACVRSLGRRGVEVHVAPADFKSPALQSRYIYKIHRLPAYIGNGSQWIDAVHALFEREKYSLVMPINDPNILPLARHREACWPQEKIAIPNDNAMAVLFDKLATRDLADSVSVPVAKGIALYPDIGCDSALEALALPLVLKPARSYEMSNLGQSRRVRIIGDRDEDAVLLIVGEGPATNTPAEEK